MPELNELEIEHEGSNKLQSKYEFLKEEFDKELWDLKRKKAV